MNLKETRQEAAKVKRAKLIQLSQAVKLAIDMGQTQAETVNQGLIEIYTDQDNSEFKTYKGWKEDGKQVQKGSNAYLVWSRKQTGIKHNEETDEDKEYKFFGIAYLFSNNQVK